MNVFNSVLEDEVSHNGDGIIKKIRAYKKSDFMTNIDFIDYVIIPPGSTIGLHQHGNNEEIYFIIEGHGEMIIDRKKKEVSCGDVIVNKINGSHGLINSSQNIMKIFIFQVST